MISNQCRLDPSWTGTSTLMLGPSRSFTNDQGGSQHGNRCQQKRTSMVYYSRGR